MPSYSVTFTTTDGPRTGHFTFDDDESLHGQVVQVLEELRLQGHLIRGGPEDELAVLWNGAELALGKTLRELGVTPIRPLELRMRPRPVRSHQILAEAYFPRGTWAAMMLAASTAAAAWAAGLFLTDLNDIITSYDDLDVALATLLGAFIGGAVSWFEAHRRFLPRAPRAALGALLGALGAGAGATAGVGLQHLGDATPGFARALVERIATWGLSAAGAGVALSLASHRRLTATLLGSLVALIGGILGGIVFNFPGPTILWQGIGFCLVGASVAWGVTGIQLGTSRALLEIEAVDRRAIGLMGARGTVLPVDVTVALPSITRRGRVDGPAPAVARFDGRRVTVQAVQPGSAAVRVGGEPLEGSVMLGDGELVEVGGTRYRLHVIAGRTS